MDNRWYVTLKLQRRIPEEPFDEPFDPDTNIRYLASDDGWTLRYYLDSEWSDELAVETASRQLVPTPKAIINIMGDKKFLGICRTHTPIIRWYRAVNGSRHFYTFRPNTSHLDGK